MILAYFGTVSNYKAKPGGSKPPHLLELRDAWTPVTQTHLAASNNHAGINGGYNSFASTIKGNLSATRGRSV
jgi:hypothetical protein